MGAEWVAIVILAAFVAEAFRKIYVLRDITELQTNLIENHENGIQRLEDKQPKERRVR